MVGEDVHGNARHLVGRMIARGEEDAVIRLLFQPIAEAVAATRGPERAADLMGRELDSLIRGARFKEFAPADQPVNAGGVTVTPASAYQIEPIGWLWPGWLAKGKVHIMAGAPGTGKTSLAMALSATLTLGSRWPDGTPAERGDVLIWSGEDDPADTLIPRLMPAGADLERVHIVASTTDGGAPRSFDPATDMALLAERVAMMDPPPAVLVVDPMVSAVAGDSHKNGEVRRALQPLVDLAMTHKLAVLGISHFSKGTAGRDPVEAGNGVAGLWRLGPHCPGRRQAARGARRRADIGAG